MFWVEMETATQPLCKSELSVVSGRLATGSSVAKVTPQGWTGNLLPVSEWANKAAEALHRCCSDQADIPWRCRVTAEKSPGFHDLLSY